MKLKTFAATLLTLAAAYPAQATTPTENIGIQVLPSPGAVTVDGKSGDWDLTGGIFACDNVEKQRDSYGVWFHAMYDAGNLYMLAHFVDSTPLNNPGQTIADYGFAGDSLQVRIVTAPGSSQERGLHLTGWHGRDNHDILDAAYGVKLDGPTVHDLKTQGAQQAFTVDPDGKGYIQEIAIPWKLLTKDGQPLRAGQQFQLTIEPNFTTPGNGRLSVKDIFKLVPSFDRVFTFMNYNEWGMATLESKGHVMPRPERIAGGREFPIHMAGGVPLVDWTGLIQPTIIPGFKKIAFTLPQDGYVSLNIMNDQGQTVCELLRGEFCQKGAHTVLWDGLTTPSAHQPGQPVPAGSYSWKALYSAGLGLKLRGWADNSGTAPWDNGPGTNWGGDEGSPSDVTVAEDRVYLGWGFAEAGKSLVATDLQGNVIWRNNRGGMSGAEATAIDNDIVYAINSGNDLFHVNAKDATYVGWGADPHAPDAKADVNPFDLWTGSGEKPKAVDGMDAKDGKVYISFAPKNAIIVIDGKLGTLIKTLTVPAPGRVKVFGDSLYVVSGGTSIVKVDPQSGAAKTIVTSLKNATGIALDTAGKIYVAVGDPDNQVKVFDASGKPAGTIGQKGGRPLQGPWQQNAMRFMQGMAVDSEGKLWVAESDKLPKRFSVWDTHTGKFVKEFFGASDYGALGGAIDPLDPNVMVGDGCEWRLDPVTGLAKCTGQVTHDGMGNSRFGVAPNGHLYLAVGNAGLLNIGPVQIFERVGEGDYRLRGLFTYEDKATHYWADANGDGTQQPNEVTTVPKVVRFSNWYMYFTQDLTIYSGDGQYKVTGFTKTGAPLYDLANPVKMPSNGEAGGMGAGSGIGSADGRMVLYNGAYAADRTTFNCYDVASGKLKWSYPNNYVGVHGSHNATPAEPGMIRGAYDFAGVAKLPAPIGNVWVIPTNVSEWHIVNEDGFYIGRLFQPNSFEFKFPDKPVPGADMTDTPPGMGGEDFGGSIAHGKDGNLYVQAGKVGFWNLQVTGLDTFKTIPGGKIDVNAADTKLAARYHDDEMQTASGAHSLSVKRLTPIFTGDLNKDFAGADAVDYKKGDATTRTEAAWDDKNLYLAWDVHDPTPWVNGATARENMYIGGDTVDFQIGTDLAADKTRGEAGEATCGFRSAQLGLRTPQCCTEKSRPQNTR